ncbi:MAG: virulence protein RhuM/Fic/DOC family protein, partial [Bacteroidetes bacterium]|nr:virulence protein RhuM/Fic/DOC family protein [Bacteroidota bacterium]
MTGIVIYKTQEQKTEIAVKVKNDTVWLNRQQISLLFNRDVKTIGKHITNIFKERELSKRSTVAKFATVQTEGGRSIQRNIEHYNLDVIISVGYRVKSKKGVQFRQWATQQLKNILIQGFAINQKRLEELGRMVQLIDETEKTASLHLSEAKGLLEIIRNYTNSFLLLNQFDANSLQVEKLNETIVYEITYKEAISAIAVLKKQLIEKKQAGLLFGKEKDDSFKSSLNSIVQTFDRKNVYSSIEEQAANLLYLIIKNHPFTDG